MVSIVSAWHEQGTEVWKEPWMPRSGKIMGNAFRSQYHPAPQCQFQTLEFVTIW